MLVRFIAHAGVYIEDGETSILIDPWFMDSTLDNPLIESVNPKMHATIDFQIPKTNQAIADYQPNVILLSHFHAHHAPLRDVKKIVGNKDGKIIIAYPDEPDISADDIRTRVGGKEKDTKLVPINNDEKFMEGNLEITAFTHTVPHHVAWFIKGCTGSVLHIADARINKDIFSRKLDPLWEQFGTLAPDIVFLSMGGNSKHKKTEEGKKVVNEGLIMTPMEAANLIREIKPKAASPIGCYNKSIWSTGSEFTFPSMMIEEEFHWALSWTSPHTRAIFFKPGQEVCIGKTKHSSSHYFI